MQRLGRARCRIPVFSGKGETVDHHPGKRQRDGQQYQPPQSLEEKPHAMPLPEHKNVRVLSGLPLPAVPRRNHRASWRAS
jgi:hypothetical protein